MGDDDMGMNTFDLSGGCTPNTTVCGNGSTLQTCSADGTTLTPTECPLGCGDTPTPHCKSFVPSVPAMASDFQSGLADTVMTTGTTYLINTDDGSISNIRGAGRGTLSQITYRATAPGTNDTGAGIFSFNSLELQEGAMLQAVGARALVIVADTTIKVTGIIDGRAYDKNSVSTPLCNLAGVAGPGGFAGATTVSAKGGGLGGGGGGTVLGGNNGGGGGGGHGAIGGTGGTGNSTATNEGPAGAVDFPAALAPMRGGSGGGSGTSSMSYGGGGGGAVQLDAGTSITIGGGTTMNGGINVGGCGGNYGIMLNSGGGGGAGGAILIESPAVNVLAKGVLAANGGGGGSYNNTAPMSGAGFRRHARRHRRGGRSRWRRLHAGRQRRRRRQRQRPAEHVHVRLVWRRRRRRGRHHPHQQRVGLTDARGQCSSSARRSTPRTTPRRSRSSAPSAPSGCNDEGDTHALTRVARNFARRQLLRRRGAVRGSQRRGQEVLPLGHAPLRSRRVPAALDDFKEAYRLKDDPVFLYNIAQCYRIMNKNEEALNFYRSYLRRAPDAPNRAEVETKIAALQDAIASQEKARTTPKTGLATPDSGTPERATTNPPTATPATEGLAVQATPPPTRRRSTRGGGCGPRWVASSWSGSRLGSASVCRAEAARQPSRACRSRPSLRDEGRRPLRDVVVALDVLVRHPEPRRRRVECSSAPWPDRTPPSRSAADHMLRSVELRPRCRSRASTRR